MRLFNWAACTLMLTACSNVETSMTILGTAASEQDDSCEFKGESDKFLSNIYFDALGSDSLALRLRVRNDLQGAQINFGSGMLPDVYNVPSAITPTRMDFRFECDTNGFSDDLGPFYVPQFSAEQSFCQQKDTREFQGFDVVPASGGAISPNGGFGIALVKPITSQLAHAMGETFLLADLANECCKTLDNIGGCTQDNLSSLPPNGNDACGDLQRAFDKIAPQKLFANKLEDVEKFRPYSIFNYTSEPPRPLSNPALGGYGPAYPMRVRGVLEGITGDGAIASSTEYFEIVHICANCYQTFCTAQ